MSSLQFFADEEDFGNLLKWINVRGEISFIVPDGPKRWKAVSQIAQLPDGKHLLWLPASGPLQLMAMSRYPKRTVIANPAAGWPGSDLPADVTGLMSSPGVGPFGTIRMELHTRYRTYTTAEKARFAELNKRIGAAILKKYPEARETGISEIQIPEDWLPRPDLMGGGDSLTLSSFGWSEDMQLLFPGAGRGGGEPVHRFSEGLINWFRLNGAALDQGADQKADRPEELWSMWALPSALRKLKMGMHYEANGFSFDAKIRAARLPRR